MSNRIAPRLIGAIAAVLTGTALVGCADSPDTTAQETTTTPAVSETTTTVQESTTTTTPAETTTTVARVDVPGEVREVLSSQANEVVTDFLDRVNRVGLRSGYVTLNETDPFGESVREVLEMTETLHDWAAYCHSVGWCEPGMYDPADREGRIEPLVVAGEGRMFAYGDETFYVEGVYSANVGEVVGYFYFTGFRFEVVDGQAVLIDAVAYDVSLGAGRASWLSLLAEEDGVALQVQGSPGLEAEVLGHTLKVTGLGDGGALLVLLEVTNTGTEPVWPYVEGGDISGAHAELYNTSLDVQIANNTATANGWSWAYGRDLEPGETAVIPVLVRYLELHVGGGEFELPIFDARTMGEDRSMASMDQIMGLKVSVLRRDLSCEVLITSDDYELSDGECMRAPVLDHEWLG